MQFIDTCLDFAQLLLPQDCLLCGSHCGSEQICSGCRSDLPFHDSAVCPICAMPSPHAEICGACIKQAPHFDATFSSFVYAFPVDAMLQALKYGGHLSIAALAGEFLAQRLAGRPLPECLIPMPMHPQRLKERGFNQAMEIARTVSRITGIPLLAEAVIRVRETKPQASLPLANRKRNMRNAFSCLQDFSGKSVAILDDVMTSGASLDELANQLKKAGAERVECWVTARTLRDGRT